MTLTQRGKPRQGAVAGTPVALNGAALVAHAMRQVCPDVVAAYPITPQTIITETFSEFAANGEVDTEFIPVESEHAAMSAVIGAAAAGARAQTATSGPGLALMWEALYVASGNRLPIVMHLCTRALSAPINILCDHSDAMGMRDAGWVMLFGETGQEAYDNAIQAVRIAEHPDVMLPTASTLDGFITTHGVERAELLPDDAVSNFVGVYHPQHYLLDPQRVATFGPMDFHDYYFEHKRQQQEAMERSRDVIRQVGREFGDLTGRYYGMLDSYRAEDAQVVAVVMGSAAGTVRTVVDQLREEGIPAGLVKVRCFRPFPAAELSQVLSRASGVAVLERSMSFGGAGNPLFMEVAASLLGHQPVPRAQSFVYGLGGRNTLPHQFRSAFQHLMEPPGEGAIGRESRYLGLRE